MEIKKKPKTCKECVSVLPPVKRGMGLNKFCSPSCYYKNKAKQDAKKRVKKPLNERSESTPTLPLTKRKRAVRIDFKPESGPILKDSPARSPEYLAFVRKKPCLVCGNKENSHAHHVYSAGLGLKCSDFYVVPLCHNHHMVVSDSIHSLGFEKFKKQHNKNLEKIMLDLVLEYFS